MNRLDYITVYELLKHSITERQNTTQEKKFIRITPSDYSDGINEFAGEQRPDVRILSNEIFNKNISVVNKKKSTNFLWLWAQFIEHEILDIKESQISANIQIPPNDPVFQSTQEIEYNRSFGEQILNNPQEQFNKINPLLDCSAIYGSPSNQQTNYIREYKYGLLKCSEGGLLPLNDGTILNNGLFVAGDLRVNKHIGLVSLHNLFVREHNYWAKRIFKICPKLTDEEIYQKAKIIIESEIQSITVNEYLPLLLGDFPKYMGYNSQLNVEVTNEFASCVSQFSNILIPTESLRGKRTKDIFFSSYIVNNEGGIDNILKDFSNRLCENIDAKIIDDLRNFTSNNKIIDFASIIIQRGRDHGLIDYNTARIRLGLTEYTSFDDFNTTEENKLKLQTLYTDINDVDLFVGGLIDRSKTNSQFGEVFSLLLKDQFIRLRDSDIFWFENRLPRNLLKIIKCTKLSDIIKRNTCIKHLQKYVMIGTNHSL